MTDADDNLRGKDTNNISKVRKNEGFLFTLRCKNFPIPLQMSQVFIRDVHPLYDMAKCMVSCDIFEVILAVLRKRPLWAER